MIVDVLKGHGTIKKNKVLPYIRYFDALILNCVRTNVSILEETLHLIELLINFYVDKGLNIDQLSSKKYF